MESVHVVVDGKLDKIQKQVKNFQDVYNILNVKIQNQFNVKILEMFIAAIGIFSIRALFTSDSHRIISREAEEQIYKNQKYEICGTKLKR